MVEDGLYRSGQPSELNFPFLEKLKLKTVVWLAPEDPNPRLQVKLPQLITDPICHSMLTFSLMRSLNFLDDQGVTLHHLGGELSHRRRRGPNQGAHL